MELLDDKTQAGYAQDAENNTHGSATTWLNTWSDVLRLCDATGISSIREFDDRFPMTQGSGVFRSYPVLSGMCVIGRNRTVDGRGHAT